MENNNSFSKSENSVLNELWNSNSFQKLFDEGRIGLFVLDPDRKIIDANHSFCLMLGYSREELLQLTAMDISHPDDINKSLNFVDANRHGDEGKSIEKRYITHSGQYLWGKIRVEIIHDENGDILNLLVMVEDITSYKEKENSLFQTKQHLLTIANGIPARVSYIDKEMRYKFVNAGYENFYKKKSINVLGKKISEVLPKPTWENAKKYIDLAFIGKQSSHYGFDEDDSMYALVELVPDFDQNEEVQGVFVLVTDITELKEAEQRLEKINVKLRASEENMRQMMEASHDTVMVVDYEGTILFVNSRVEEMFGYKVNELIGAPVEMLVPDVLREQHQKHRASYQKKPK
ncbi:PAS domain S-box protein, partial [Gammaproteobacteria bacterium]|nr:PAS domain S-box protein [Gammaproteobacteria bacterium]